MIEKVLGWKNMNEAEFDKFAEEYRNLHAASIAISGEQPDYFAEYKIADITREYYRLPHVGSASPAILDFGAGSGGLVPFVRRHLPGSQLTCLDVSKRCLEVAEKRFPACAQYVHFDGIHIPFSAEHFHIAYAACVFHHIDPTEHVPLLQELRRVIRPDGMLAVFEHNPYNPLTVRIVNNCVFDENAQLIRAGKMKKQLEAAGFSHTRIRYRIFFPHALRILRPLERVLTWLPLGGQYYVLARR